MAEYARLRDRLARVRKLGVGVIRLSIEELESILGSGLPAEATLREAWWVEERQAAIWMQAGFAVAVVDLDAGYITFGALEAPVMPALRTAGGNGRVTARRSEPSRETGAEQEQQLLVITSCTKRKMIETPHALTLDDLRDERRYHTRVQQLAHLALPAVEMYRGVQHLQVVSGVRSMRSRLSGGGVRLAIVSAGFGLLDEREAIVPYDITFSGMDAATRRALAERTRVPERVREATLGWPVVLFLLGSSYLKALNPPLEAESGQRLLFLASARDSRRLAGPGVTVVPSGAESAWVGGSHISRKGLMFSRFAREVVARGPGLLERVRSDDSPETFLAAVRAGGR